MRLLTIIILSTLLTSCLCTYKTKLLPDGNMTREYYFHRDAR